MRTIVVALMLIFMVCISLMFTLNRLQRAQAATELHDNAEAAGREVNALPGAVCNQVPRSNSRYSQEALAALDCEEPKAP